MVKFDQEHCVACWGIYIPKCLSTSKKMKVRYTFIPGIIAVENYLNLIG